MPKINRKSHEYQPKQGSGGGTFDPLPTEGWYATIIKNVEYTLFSSKKGVQYCKYTPKYRVINGNLTHIIEREDIVIGEIENGELVEKEGEIISKSANNFLQNMGMFLGEEDDFDIESVALMQGRVVLAKMAFATYCKENSDYTFRHWELTEWIEEKGLVLEKMNLTKLIALLREWINEDVRVKSVPVYFLALEPNQARTEGYYVEMNGDTPTGAIFKNESAYEEYLVALKYGDIDDIPF